MDDLFQSTISLEKNKELSKIPEPQEVKNALWSINSLKSLGTDGVSTLFYKKHWNTIGLDIINFVQEFFQTIILELEINSTLIIFLYKRNLPTSITHYRPISFYNVVYKIIDKLLVGRFIIFLDIIISLYQAKRWIVKNTILAQAILHTMKTKKGRGVLVGFKIDINKAREKMECKLII